MKVQLRLVSASLLAVLCLAVAILPAAAGNITLYSNGPASTNDTNAWAIGPIHSGNFVTNSFYIGVPSTITAFSFAAWVPIGDTPSYVAYSIGTTPFDYDVGLGAMYPLSFSYLWSNASTLCLPASAGCDVYEVTVTVAPSVSLGIGTYWLTLDDGVTTGYERMLWDENGGTGCTGWNNSGAALPGPCLH